MLSPLIPATIPPEGLRIPVDEIRCSFWLLGFLPGSSHNSISPQLVLLPQEFEIKVINTSRHAYTAIKRVSYQPARWLGREQVVLKLNDGTDYYIKPSYGLTAPRLLRFFQQQGLLLSAAAQQAVPPAEAPPAT